MSVMKRKLFNREARDELRRMGGIMASSEPLMMAAQGYAPGGVVEPQQVFSPRSGLGSNINYTYADFLQENGLKDSPQAREMFVRYQQYVESQVASGPLVNPASENKFLDQPLEMSEPPMAMDAPSSLPAGTTRPVLAGPARGSGLEALRKADAELSVPSMMTESVPVTPSEELISSKLDPVAQAREDEINRLLAVFDAPDRTEAQVKAARQRLEQIGSRDRLISAGIDLGEIVGDRIASDAAGIYGAVGTGANLLGFTDAATALFEMEKEAEAKVSPAKPDAAEAAEVVEDAEAAEVVEDAEVQDIVDDTKTALKFPDLSEIDDGTGTDFTAIPKKADKLLPELKKDIEDADTEEEFDSVFDKYVKTFIDILDEDEDKAAKDKAFAMAMFGATYASTGDFGQASAVMIDMLRGDAATRQERKDKIKMLALQAVLDEKKEDRARDALLAKEERTLTNAIKLAAAKAYIEGQNDNEAVDNIVKVVNTFAGTGAGIEKAIEIATRNSNIPEEIMKEVYKQFGITPPSAAQKTPTGGAQSLDDIM